MKKLFSTFIVATFFASGSALAGDGPAPLNLSQLDMVSAGASAAVKGGTSLSWGRHGVDIDNYAKGKAYGNALEAADASQYTLIEGAGLGKVVAWGAAGGTKSTAAAISYGKRYFHIAHH